MKSSRILLIHLALLAGGAGFAAEPPADAPALRVMSFNIRYGAAQDGVNNWDKRRDLCAARIITAAPDLVGMQEALGYQNAFLLGQLKDYALVGVSREDGKDKGEFSPILYRTGRFTPVASGTFWLSETPEVAGSKGWDAPLPRIATWVRLRDQRRDGRELLCINTHLDSRGPKARLASAQQLRRFIAGQGKGLPVILTGDFNAGPGSEPVRALLDAGTDGVSLVDTYAVAHPNAPEAEGWTFHAFTGAPGKTRIDWILATPELAVRGVEIDRFQDGERFPSDHFPVIATLAWP